MQLRAPPSRTGSRYPRSYSPQHYATRSHSSPIFTVWDWHTLYMRKAPVGKEKLFMYWSNLKLIRHAATKSITTDTFFSLSFRLRSLALLIADIHFFAHSGARGVNHGDDCFGRMELAGTFGLDGGLSRGLSLGPHFSGLAEPYPAVLNRPGRLKLSVSRFLSLY